MVVSVRCRFLSSIRPLDVFLQIHGIYLHLPIESSKQKLHIINLWCGLLLALNVQCSIFLLVKFGIDDLMKIFSSASSDLVDDSTQIYLLNSFVNRMNPVAFGILAHVLLLSTTRHTTRLLWAALEPVDLRLGRPNLLKPLRRFSIYGILWIVSMVQNLQYIMNLT